jgi:hypothetical protein
MTFRHDSCACDDLEEQDGGVGILDRVRIVDPLTTKEKMR